MKIFVDEISEGGIELTEDIQPGALLIDTEAISFISPIEVKANVLKSGNEIFIDMSLQAPVEYTCGKCLSRFQDTLKKRFKVIREAKPQGVVELDDEIRQEIILDYPMKIICRDDCKGLCPNCGQNLNIAECECNNEK